jgi:choline dehydrogenase-like flavoprotein
MVAAEPPADSSRRLSISQRLKCDPADILEIPIAAAFETKPNLSSRVTLSDNVDALGQPRAKLTWFISDEDRAEGQRAFDKVRNWLSQQAFQFSSGDDPGSHGWQPVGGAHHIGTTRMARDAKRGIVDKDLRAHGFDNFFICGSSVFPSNTFGNPTFPIVCLSLRLASHLLAHIRTT